MKLSRKLISITLAIVIALSCFSVCAFAALSYTDRIGRLSFTAGTASEVDDYIANVNNPGSYTSLSITGIPGVNFQAALQRLSNLTSITFNNCEITDISWLSYGSNLQTVELNDNKIWDLSPISSMLSIKTLSLNKNLITNIVPLFTNSKHNYIHISLEDNFISDPVGIVGSRFAGVSGTYVHLDNNFIYLNKIEEYYNNTSKPYNMIKGHLSFGNQKSAPDQDPFVAIVENGISKIVGFFGDPDDTEVTVGANAYTSKTSTGEASGQITNATQIAEKAFANNVNVESWYISDNINFIDTFAFSSCTNMKRIRLSNSLTTLKKQTFYACINLLGVCIPNSVTTFETKVFDLCKRLKYVEFSNKDTFVHPATFYRCSENHLTVYVSSAITDSVWQMSTLKSSLEDILYVNLTLDRNLSFANGTVNGAELSSSTLRIPAGIDNISCNSSVVHNNISLSMLLIPEGVTNASINFAGAVSSNVDVVVPKTLTDISGITFGSNTPSVTAHIYVGENESANTVINGITNTQNFTFDTLYTIAYDVLEKYHGVINNPYNTNETNLTLADYGYDTIGFEALCGITGNTYNSLGNYLKSVTLPDGIIEIKPFAFKRLKMMETINFASTSGNEYLEIIGSAAFYYCLYINNVLIPSTVTSIESEAFYYCTRLTNIVFATGSHLTEIGDGAFQNCTGLVTITLPRTVKTLGARVFKNDTSLTTIDFGTDPLLESIGESVFENCTNLRNNSTSVNTDTFVIPPRVKLIPMHAFAMPYSADNSPNNSFSTIVLPPLVDKLIQGNDIALIDQNTCGLVDGAFENFYTTGRTIVLTCEITDDNRQDVLTLIDYLEGLGFTVVPSYDEAAEITNLMPDNMRSYAGMINSVNSVNNDVDAFDMYENIKFDYSAIVTEHIDIFNGSFVNKDELLHQIALEESMYYSSLI